MAAFSSRGPLIAGAGDLLKPDIGAPGVDVLAAVAPPGQRGREFDLFSGTSMSAPHIAGIAALLKQLHPDWSPMAIKSALMTTAVDGIEPFTDTPAADASALRAFAQGAGHVQPNSAADPGLVFDSDFRDWFAFLCGATTGVNPALCAQLSALGFSFDRSDMNVPSIAIGDLAGVQTVKRRVTNVDDKPATYTASTSINGVNVAVSPSSFSINPGETKTIEVSFTVTTAPLNRYTAGTMTLASKDNNVRIPLVVRPVAFGAQGEASSNGSPVELAGAGGLQRPAQRHCRRPRPGDGDRVTRSRGSGSDLRPDRSDRNVLDSRSPSRPVRSSAPGSTRTRSRRPAPTSTCTSTRARPSELRALTATRTRR